MGQARDASVVLDAAYKLAQGQGKNRMSATGTFVEPTKFNLLFLSSGEMSFADYHRQTMGRSPMAGQKLRFLDIPWDDVINPPLKADWADHDKLFTYINHSIEGELGHINELIMHMSCPIVQAGLKDRFETTLARYKSTTRKGSRVAVRFALLGLGAEISRDIGLLPQSWDPHLGPLTVFERFEKQSEAMDEGLVLATEFRDKLEEVFNDRSKTFPGDIGKGDEGIIWFFGKVENLVQANSERCKKFLIKNDVLIKDTSRGTYNFRFCKRGALKINYKRLNEVVDGD